jgi:hypothetical protein
VETVPERLEPATEPAALESLEVLAPERAAVRAPARPRLRSRARDRAMSATRRDVLWLMSIYLATRLVLLLAAYLQGSFRHGPFLNELANWDGLWYREVANHGYLNHPSDAQTTLGFFPLYPLAMWALEPVFSVFTGSDPAWMPATISGTAISMAGGAVATYFVYRLAEGWWDRAAARRATVLFIIFPGSVVFSMVYSEGLLLPLAAACIYALERRRWLLAGCLAGLGTAVQPTGLVLVGVCGVAALLELRRQGWSPRVLPKVSLAPLLSLTGIGAFALFLWVWTGTPLANYRAQHHGWGEKTDPLAIVHTATMLVNEISFAHFNRPTINLNLIVGLIGAVLLIGMLMLVARERRRISPAALTWTIGISFLALTSEYVPPNPRMLVTAFPALMAVAVYARGRRWAALLWTNGILFVGLSVLTYWGTTLRP